MFDQRTTAVWRRAWVCADGRSGQEGQVVADDFSTYVMPGALDLPEVVSLACASDEATGPFGMKGVGEVAMNGPLPAVANAIAHATGVRVYRAPITPQALWQALDGPSTTENTR
jgi:CO/xanthine dehydrogenase Mo-binding subunit